MRFFSRDPAQPWLARQEPVPPGLDAAIGAVDWLALPHPDTDCYQAECIEPSLRQLASSTSVRTIVLADAALAGCGLVNEHSAQLFPAAVPATPILLDILLGDGHPQARQAAKHLLAEAMQCLPHAGYTRTPTGIPLCCAVAHLVQERRDALATLGELTRGLLRVADEHWSFRVTEVGTDHGGTFVLGTLAGKLPPRPDPAECHVDGSWKPVGPVRLEKPLRLRLDEAKPEDVPAGGLLLARDCGECVH